MEFSNTRLAEAGISPAILADVFYLEDIADVWRGFVDPPSEMARANNQSAIVLAISMAENGRITERGPAVTQKLDALTADLPLAKKYRLPL